MRVFLLSGEIAGSSIYKLSKKERRYLFSVLRLSINDTFTAKDKDGRYFKAFLYDEESLTLEKEITVPTTTMTMSASRICISKSQDFSQIRKAQAMTIPPMSMAKPLTRGVPHFSSSPPGSNV